MSGGAEGILPPRTFPDGCVPMSATPSKFPGVYQPSANGRSGKTSGKYLIFSYSFCFKKYSQAKNSRLAVRCLFYISLFLKLLSCRFQVRIKLEGSI